MTQLAVGIDDFDERDRAAVLNLFRAAFEPVLGSDPKPRTDAFLGRLHRESTRVARTSRKVVGFCTALPIDAAEDEIRQGLHLMLMWCRTPVLAPPWLAANGGLRPGRLPPALIEQPEREAIVTELAVWPHYRRSGVGRSLVEAQLARAAAWGARRAFAYCWRAGPSVTLFHGLGFRPLLRYPGFYGDGSAMTLVARQLRDPKPQETGPGGSRTG